MPIKNGSKENNTNKRGTKRAIPTNNTQSAPHGAFLSGNALSRFFKKESTSHSKFSKNVLTLDGSTLTAEAINNFIQNTDATVAIAPAALTLMKKTRKVVTDNMTKRPIYGVNTGFGPMVTHIIAAKELVSLQYNLLRGHAVGMGEPVKDEFVLAAMLVRLNTIVKGNSGASPELALTFTELINHRIIPIVPEHGAVGTSGDLVQLAHIALAVIGEGEVMYQGRRRATKDALAKAGIKPHQLGPKEGLSLINGTSMMSGIASLLVLDAERISDIAVRTGTLAFELMHGFTDVLHPELHRVRPHEGQESVAGVMRGMLKSSKLLSNRDSFVGKIHINGKTHVTKVLLQEVYSLRCMPQILGPIIETIRDARKTVTTEVNSVTDNPIIDIKNGHFLHGGNFHGDYVATAMDQMKAALVKLTLLTERRVNLFLNQNINKHFPPFLNVNQPGLTMALQGLQFVATSTTAQSQSLAYPHSLHSISTNGDNQDVVSMGTDAALLAAKVIDNAYTLLAIELVTLAQAVDVLGAKNQLSDESKTLVEKVRSIIPTINADRPLTNEIMTLCEAMKESRGLVQ